MPNMKISQKIISRVLNIEHLTESTFIISLTKPKIKFQAGQYMILNLPGEKESREYSIYNKVNDEHFEFLIRTVEGGYLSDKLKSISKGATVELEGPYGFFTLSASARKNQEYIFISTGTGISPIHSLVKSHTNINYKLIHGIRYAEEKYQYQDYKNNYKACISGSQTIDFYGRVTDYLKTHQVQNDALFYLSGNSSMINEVTNMLISNNISLDKINTEIYF